MAFQLISPSDSVTSPGSPGSPCFYKHESVDVPHGFFTADGGVSTGLYESLNCGFGSADDAALVTANRGSAATSLGLGPDDLAAVYQVHGNDCITVTGATSADRDALPRADGIVTRTPGLGLSILTADCLPLLLVDTAAGVIGACHAGWRGACDGISGNTITAMKDLGADKITALIGPTIQQRSYQVGAEMRAAVIAASGNALPTEVIADCFAPEESGDKYRFDLPAYVRARLVADGIDAIYDCGIDTYNHSCGDSYKDGHAGRDKSKGGESPAFFSHRAATHAGAADSGRQISMIALP